jgi:hypothetical protein
VREGCHLIVSSKRRALVGLVGLSLYASSQLVGLVGLALAFHNLHPSLHLPLHLHCTLFLHVLCAS